MFEGLRVALGCMRLSTDGDRDEARAIDTIRAALDAGITFFDTAHSYGWNDDELGHNERLLARVLRETAAASRATIITKGGMRRPNGLWRPDGRASSIRRDCAASLEALGGLPIDLYLLHAPDPRTPWETSLRALRALLEDGSVRRIGVSNVNRTQLERALELAPISAVQVALSPFDDTAIAGGVLALCAERGITLLAHSPLGGTKRAPKLERDPLFSDIAARHNASAAETVLATLRALDPCVVPVVGARRPETARSGARSGTLVLRDEDLQSALKRFPARVVQPARSDSSSDGEEVVLVMGLQGSGKTEHATRWIHRGYRRLNRDERGGTLRGLALELDSQLAAGARRVVLDNTFLTRAVRRTFIDVASKHRLPVRGIWLEVPMADAQVNVIDRMLAAHGRLLEPDELRRGDDPSQLAPTAQFRSARELELPSADEGFSSLDVVPFRRRPTLAGKPGRFVSFDALRDSSGALDLLGNDRELARLVFAWKPTADPLVETTAENLRTMGADFELSICSHPGGPPRCWCRPPLPGLLIAFARKHDVNLSRSTVVGTGPAHKQMAAALGATYVAAD